MSDTYSSQPAPAPYPAGSPTPTPSKGSNGLATAGFILGLLGLLGSWIPILNVVAMILAVIGIVLAGVGLAKSKKANAGKGLAIAGLILGVLALIFAVLINAVFVGAVDEAIDETTGTSVKAPGDSSDMNSDDEGGSDDALGTTRDNPAPLGSEISGGDWTVTVNSVKTADQDSYGSKPASGSTLLVINMTATYTGDDEQGESAWATVDFVTADGTTMDDLEGSTLFIADNEFDSLKTVYGGASIKGDQILEVPADGWQDGVLAVSPDVLSDDTFVAVQ